MEQLPEGWTDPAELICPNSKFQNGAHNFTGPQKWSETVKGGVAAPTCKHCGIHYADWELKMHKDQRHPMRQWQNAHQIRLFNGEIQEYE